MVLFFAVSVMAAADISGTWSGSSTGGDQGGMQFTMTFRTVNGALAGTLSTGDADMPLENLKLDGSSISFQLSTDSGVYKVTGTVDGDKMSGTYSSDAGQSGTWQAERQKAAATPTTI